MYMLHMAFKLLKFFNKFTKNYVYFTYEPPKILKTFYKFCKTLFIFHLCPY